MAINRPPQDITPQAFFSDWLPNEYSALRAAAGDAPPPPDTVVSVTVDGDGGGAWTLSMTGGDLSVSEGADAGALVALTQTVQDWRAIIVGEDGAPDFMPENANPIDLMLRGDQGAADMLKTVNGTFVFVVGDFNGRDWKLRLSFNGAAEPEATISVDTGTIAQIRSGEMAAPQAYFSGKIQITGDAAFAMQLGMQLMARMNQ